MRVLKGTGSGRASLYTVPYEMTVLNVPELIRNHPLYNTPTKVQKEAVLGTNCGLLSITLANRYRLHPGVMRRKHFSIPV